MFIRIKGLYNISKKSWVEDRVVNTDYIRSMRRLTQSDKDAVGSEYDYSVSFEDGVFYVNQGEFNRLCSAVGVK